MLEGALQGTVRLFELPGYEAHNADHVPRPTEPQVIPELLEYGEGPFRLGPGVVRPAQRVHGELIGEGHNQRVCGNSSVPLSLGAVNRLPADSLRPHALSGFEQRIGELQQELEAIGVTGGNQRSRPREQAARDGCIAVERGSSGGGKASRGSARKRMRLLVEKAQFDTAAVRLLEVVADRLLELAEPLTGPSLEPFPVALV